jgi:hypothetical protein
MTFKAFKPTQDNLQLIKDVFNNEHLVVFTDTKTACELYYTNFIKPHFNNVTLIGVNNIYNGYVYLIVNLDTRDLQLTTKLLKTAVLTF